LRVARRPNCLHTGSQKLCKVLHTRLYPVSEMGLEVAQRAGISSIFRVSALVTPLLGKSEESGKHDR